MASVRCTALSHTLQCAVNCDTIVGCADVIAACGVGWNRSTSGAGQRCGSRVAMAAAMLVFNWLVRVSISCHVLAHTYSGMINVL